MGGLKHVYVTTKEQLDSKITSPTNKVVSFRTQYIPNIIGSANFLVGLAFYNYVDGTEREYQLAIDTNGMVHTRGSKKDGTWYDWVQSVSL